MKLYTRPLFILKDSGGAQVSTHRYEFQAIAKAKLTGVGTYTLEGPSRTLVTGASGPDIIAPIMTLIGSSTMVVYTDMVFTDLGATAVDETDGALAVTVSGAVDTTIPGDYVLTYTAIDAAGNGSSLQRTVTIEDAPVTGANNFYIVAPSGTYTVYPDIPLAMTYEDAAFCYCVVAPADDVGPVIFDWNGSSHTENTSPYHQNGDLVTVAFPTGTNTIVVTIPNGVYNIILEVAEPGTDVTAPEISIIGWNPVYVDTNGTYNELGVTLYDFADPNPTYTTTGSVNTSVPGTYTITYTATDAANNQSVATRNVIVADAPTGTATVYITSLTVPPESLMYGRTFEIGDPIVYDTSAVKDSGGYATVVIDSLGVPTLTGNYGMYEIVATWTNQTTNTPEAL